MLHSAKTGAQLSAAIKSAKAGDTIVLAEGDYGHLNLRNVHFADDVTIKAPPGVKASFSKVNFAKVSNVTFDGVILDQNSKSGTSKAFVFNDTKGISILNSVVDGTVGSGGTGSGQGLWIVNAEDFRFEDSVLKDFHTGIHARTSSGLTFTGNTIENIGLDAMIIGKVDGVLIEGNDISLNTKSGTKHTDGIQFWNTGENQPSSDIVIRGNHIETNNTASHGIYMANGNAGAHGKAAAFKNVLIEDNVVVSGQVSGIAWGRTDGLDIRNNVLLQDTDVKSTKVIHTPAIRVEKTSTDVEITGNVTHVKPTSSGGNWAPDKSANPAWKIADNKIVKTGTKVEDVKLAPSKPPVEKPVEEPVSDTAPTEPPAEVKPGKPSGDDGGNGKADTLRIDGPKAGTTKISGLDFTEGDQIRLINFRADTFDHFGGGNKLGVKKETFATIDSILDLQELDAASSRVKINDLGTDALRIEISQKGGGTHVIELTDMAQDYSANWNDALF